MICQKETFSPHTYTLCPECDDNEQFNFKNEMSGFRRQRDHDIKTINHFIRYYDDGKFTSGGAWR